MTTPFTQPQEPADSVPKRALLVVGHGTIEDLADVPEFLRRIRRGRAAPPQLEAEVRRRYARIGRSPLLVVTRSLARGLEERLGLPTHVAMRFWEPLVSDVVADLVAPGARSVRSFCILPVAPFSVPVYVDVVREVLAAGSIEGVELLPVAPYGSDRALVEAHASAIRPSLAARDPVTTRLVLSAHSLPLRVLESGDAYQREFEASAAAIAGSLGWPAVVAYQSQSEGGGPWLGPTLHEVLRSAADEGKRDVVVAPVGFLADHVETLFDLDVEAREQAESLGLGFHRVPALNDDPRLADALAAVARRAMG